MTHGPDAVHELIVESETSYPVSVRRLEEEHALSNVEIDKKGHSMMLAELLSQADVNRFEDEADLRRKLQPFFERERQRRHVGIFGRLKRVFLGR